MAGSQEGSITYPKSQTAGGQGRTGTQVCEFSHHLSGALYHHAGMPMAGAYSHV